MAKKGLTYDELMALARANYDKGGDATFECWDKAFYDAYCAEFGPLTKREALMMFKVDLDYERDGIIFHA